MADSFLPRVRSAELLVRPVGDELTLHDQRRGHFHALNPAATQLWKAIDGTRTSGEIAVLAALPEAIVLATLSELADLDLLDAPGRAPKVNRRTVVKHLAASGALGGVLLPVIGSVTGADSVLAAISSDACELDPCATPECPGFCEVCLGSPGWCATCAESVYYCAYCSSASDFCDRCAGTPDYCARCTEHRRYCDVCGSHSLFCSNCLPGTPLWCASCTSHGSFCRTCPTAGGFCTACQSEPTFCANCPGADRYCAACATDSKFCANCGGIDPYCTSCTTAPEYCHYCLNEEICPSVS